jgi:hypothetical protein
MTREGSVQVSPSPMASTPVPYHRLGQSAEAHRRDHRLCRSPAAQTLWGGWDSTPRPRDYESHGIHHTGQPSGGRSQPTNLFNPL